jgi:hypothetical protein
MNLFLSLTFDDRLSVDEDLGANDPIDPILSDLCGSLRILCIDPKLSDLCEYDDDELFLNAFLRRLLGVSLPLSSLLLPLVVTDDLRESGVCPRLVRLAP